MTKKGQRPRWWLVTTSYPCDTCGAGPGDACVTRNGNHSATPHADRTQIASRHDWMTAEEVAAAGGEIDWIFEERH